MDDTALLHTDPDKEVASLPGSDKTASAPISILLLDEQRVVREALKLLIERSPCLHVVGEAEAYQEALELAGRKRPDVILLDLNIAGGNGASVIPELLAASGDARVILFMNLRDLQAYQSTVLLGARGVVLKQDSSEALIQAIENVYTGGIWMSPTTGCRLSARDAGSDRGSEPTGDKRTILTHREREVLRVVTLGLKNKQIAQRLFISEATVSHHLTSIFKKLGVSDRSHLIAYAHRQRLASD